MLQRYLLVILQWCLLLALGSVSLHAETIPSKPSLIDWQEWSAESFAKAKKENKLVIMDVEAVWCHWCHVMDAKTYHNPRVASLINKHFVAIRVDQDAHPDISNRYEDYGWPATIIFDSEGKEIVKRRGYIGPKFMGWFLEAVIAEPTADAHDNKQETVKVGLTTSLNDEQKKMLMTRYDFIYDKKHAGWGRRQKFIHSDSIEYAMVLAQNKAKNKAKNSENKKYEKRAKDTLDAARALIDPEWGGVYQYSDEADWQSPHFEKVMLIQTDALRLYAMAYELWGRKKDLQSALKISTYLVRFLRSPEGVYYTSQDADLNDKIDGHAFFSLKDKQRKELGIPRVDKHIYSRENGWVLSALLALYSATGEKTYLTQAKHIADWVIGHYSVKDKGGFQRDANSNTAIFLADTLAMGQGFLDLYEATNEQSWLSKAEAALIFINKNFKDPAGGYSTRAMSDNNLLLTPVKHINSQILMARFANKVYRYTGNKRHRELALHTMRYLTSADLTQQRRLLAGILLTDYEINK
jgi:uncharacterized protein YyaL (SSP411 family)